MVVPLPDYIQGELKEMLLNMLNLDADKRPTAKELLDTELMQFQAQIDKANEIKESQNSNELQKIKINELEAKVRNLEIENERMQQIITEQAKRDEERQQQRRREEEQQRKQQEDIQRAHQLLRQQQEQEQQRAQQMISEQAKRDEERQQQRRREEEQQRKQQEDIQRAHQQQQQGGGSILQWPILAKKPPSVEEGIPCESCGNLIPFSEAAREAQPKANAKLPATLPQDV
ncbi:MAG: hypothetical protein EZS28_048480 [Streblomastix strix]|uniref:Protein kinase domain-containing protein n=1 Tax=Streblomastix strix TaxID=222440 RepID=A0A5J4TDZ4_9EUKA|nr:MAG: hypothetical protein EZS28_048480 [Streblomastix strix]